MAGCVAIERINTGSRVVETGYAVNGRVVKERLIPGGRVCDASGVAKERITTGGCVLGRQWCC